MAAILIVDLDLNCKGREYTISQLLFTASTRIYLYSLHNTALESMACLAYFFKKSCQTQLRAKMDIDN